MSEKLFADEVEMIAVIGMACRFPGSSSVDEFWKNIRDGVESVTRFSDEELLAAGVDRDILADPNYVKARGRLDGYDLFDANFFGFTPSEASVTDPQHRLFLECSWEAMEHAGYDPRNSGKGTGVFAGSGLNTYALRNLMSSEELLAREGEYRILIGNDKDFVATRTSYKLDLNGPSLNISTACSTSLVAVHYGCSSLLGYQCDMALAGAVSIYIPQDQGYMHEPGGILSADGHCRPFSAEAGGTVGGAGVGVVVLKRLSEALADGDTIHAIIRGTAVNNDGAEKIGFTAPSVDGQAQVIVEAQSIAAVPPESIGYVEAHGTGTVLGDPIEIAALTSAFTRSGPTNGVCYLGSVKSNFGHCDTAAGMAGLIKTVLALKNRKIPPTLHCERTHPEIDFTSTPFRVNTSLQNWKRGDTPRRAGVSSFGVGGTNAHVILEEVEVTTSSPGIRPWYLLPISARTPAALERMGQRLSDYLDESSAVNLDDLAYTLQVGRSHFPFKKTVLCHDRESALAGLSNTQPGVHHEGGEPQIAFLFSGQGTQYVGMGKELYQSSLVFREEVDRCASILQPLLKKDIRQILHPDETEKEDAERLLQQTAWTQPVLFVLEYALARFLMSLGVSPTACLGHSLGEYVAACIAGVFSLEDGLCLIVERGRLMQEMVEGAMLAVSATPEQLAAEGIDRVAVAAINTQGTCVLSGSYADIERIEESLNARDIANKRLVTSHAFHSGMMIPAVKRFVQVAAKMNLSKPGIRIVSNVTGGWLSDSQATDPEYWGQHLLSTVRFADGLETIFTEAPYLTVEIGPGQTLASFARAHSLCTSNDMVCTTIPHCRIPDDHKNQVFPELLAKLWESGVSINWYGLYRGERRLRVPLPTYPFERQRYFIDPARRTCQPAELSKERIRHDPADWFYRHSWKRAGLPLAGHEESPVQHWLIFSDSGGTGRAVARKLEQGGATVHYVNRGDTDISPAGIEYAIDPLDKKGYERLLESLAWDDIFPDGIVYCWSLDGKSSSRMKKSEDTDRALYYDALILLVQALEQCRPGHEVLLTVVTSGMFEVVGNESIDPEISLVMGPVTVIPQEHPHMDCKVVDLQYPDELRKTDVDVITTLTDLCKRKVEEPVIALRGSYCWVRTFEPVSLPAVSAKSQLRSGGVYLIAGGMGGIGLQLAEYLAHSAGARLALVSRKGLPARKNDPAQQVLTIPWDEKGWRNIDQDRGRIEQECSIQTIRQRGSLESRLNCLCATLVLNYFSKADINTREGASHSVRALKKRLGIAPEFSRLFAFFLSLLVDNEQAKLAGDTITFLGLPVERIDQNEEVVSLSNDYPAFALLVRFLKHCADNYPEALTSTAEAISVLYPDGDSSALREIASDIEEHTFHRVYCMLLAEKLKNIVDAAGGRQIRILEIGGGAGILTKHVIALLGDENIQYTFTDIGPTFVAEAREWASANGYQCMRFGTLDVSRDITTQGYKSGDFDVIIELDVVHATPHIGSSLHNLKRLLAPNGLLLMAESTATPCWTTMIYGLAEGWWLYEDTDLRPEGPLLTPEKWETVMSKVGFEDVHVYPLEEEKRQEHDCCLVIGKAPKHTFNSANSDAADPLSQQIGRLEEAGAQVRTFAADISDLKQMAAVVRDVEAEFGTIHGVIHSAAVEHRGAIQLKEVGTEGQEFAAKVRGTKVLDELFRDRALDFMFICSSITSILGGVGDVEYTAVNAFADAFGQARAKTAGDPGRYTVSVAWDRWIATGMAIAFEERVKAISGERPVGGMSASEGREAFGRILANRCGPQIVVSTRPFNDWVREARADTSEHIADQRRPAAAIHRARPDLEGSYVAPENDTQKRIAALWQEVLGLERIGINDEFSEIGGDSLIAIKVVARLNESFKTNITVRTLFEDPTVARLSERIEALRVVSSKDESQVIDGWETEETGTL